MSDEELTDTVANIIGTITRSIKTYDEVAGKDLKLPDGFEVIPSSIETYDEVAGKDLKLPDGFEVIPSSIETYDDVAGKDLKLPAGFEVGRCQLNQLLDNLKTCNDLLHSIEASLPANVFASLERTFKICEEKADKIQQIFDVLHYDARLWETRYAEVLAMFGPGNTIEELTTAISEEVEIILNYVKLKSSCPLPKIQPDDIPEVTRTIVSRATFIEIQTNNTGHGQQFNIGNLSGNVNWGMN